MRVIFLHSLSYYFTTLSKIQFGPSFPDWVEILSEFLRLSVPVFVMIAGFKFYFSRRRNPGRKYFGYLQQRLVRLGIPYLFWSIAYYLFIGYLYPSVIHQNPEFHGYPIPGFHETYLILSGIANPGFQLWFIPMLLLVNVIYPLIFRSSTRYYFSLPILLILHFVFLRYSAKPLNYFCYLFYFNLGDFFAYIFHGKKYKSVFLSIGVSGLIVSVWGVYYRVFSSGQFFTRYILELSTPLAIFCLLSILFLKFRFRPLVSLGKQTWPIYILHVPLVMNLFASMIFHKLLWHSPASIFLLGSCVTLSCILLSYLFDKSGLSQVVF